MYNILCKWGLADDSTIFIAILVMELFHPCAIVSVPLVANIGMGMHGLMPSETPFRSNLSHVLSWKMSLLLLMLFYFNQLTN